MAEKEVLHHLRSESTVTLRVHVPNNWVLGALVIVIVVQALEKYRKIRCLDPRDTQALNPKP